MIVHAVAQATGEDFQVGVQLMRNALKASLAVAKVAGGWGSRIDSGKVTAYMDIVRSLER